MQKRELYVELWVNLDESQKQSFIKDAVSCIGNKSF
jgi:hypothetical protein